ncbi:MAG TPA: NADPH-dependent oxidoreductase [Acidobacteriota bacterium]|nr:NADPH-dependent oxidoreductase [Acidobacteriota bacterium]
MTNPTITSLRAHHSIRRFTSEPVTDAELETILTTGQRASTSSNLQSYSVIVVRDQERKAKLAELCGGQRQVAECPVFLAHCADLNRAKMLCDAAGYEFRAQCIEFFILAVIDAAIFAEKTLDAAEAIGLGGCMIGGARNKPFEIAELLGLPPLVFIAFGMTLGRPDPEHVPAQRPRLPLAGIVHHERYDTAHLAEAHAEYDCLTRATGLYQRRLDLSSRLPGWRDTTPEGEYGWAEQSARRWIDPVAVRADLRRFLDRQGFGFE